MKRNYKFNINQLVYIHNDDRLKDDWQRLKVRKRTKIDGIYYYQFSKLQSYKFDSINKMSKPIFEKEIFDIGFRNMPRADNWLQEDKIIGEEPKFGVIDVCSKNGCEIINEFLEYIPGELNTDDKTKQEIDTLNKLVSRKEIEIRILQQVFDENINKLEQELNGYLYNIACLQEDEHQMKYYLLDAIE